MTYKHYTIQIIIRIFLLLIVMAILVIGVLYFEYIKSFFILIVFLYQIIELIRYINKINYEYINFLNALANKDYSASYPKSKKGKSFNNLYSSFDKISKQFRTLNFERELQFENLQTLIKHIDIGIISYNEQEKVHLVNDSFKKIFNCPNLNSNQSISVLNTDLIHMISSMKQGESQLFQWKSGNSSSELSLNATNYKLKNKNFKLISVKNIHSELDSKEQESYQKLISVLTHEIMNSVSPIVSLSSTLDQTLEKKKDINELKIESIKEAIHAIHDRSRNLLNFTHEYRKLTKLPNPILKNIDIKIILEKINQLYQEDLKKHNIGFDIQINDDIQFISADEALLEQVLINIYKNAFEAIENEKKPMITTIVSLSENNCTCIQIKDNGHGITAEKLSKVFIPFYSDKENGSGIGLSLCKQILKLHGGKITIDSVEHQFTSVNLYFPQNNQE